MQSSWQVCSVAWLNWRASMLCAATTTHNRNQLGTAIFASELIQASLNGSERFLLPTRRLPGTLFDLARVLPVPFPRQPIGSRWGHSAGWRAWQ
mmetsp:Transcript_76581/g.219721  ORF Transcript_76581/g.219721 Transcript_76581/m.219721 type:complete len:94 (-) Transcript_76581:141-422(-)